MIKSLFVGRRAAGISRAVCHDHLLTIHGPMVVCAPPGSGPLPSDYVQNHVFDGVYPAAGPHAIERDFATQLWAESLDTMKASASSPYYLANMKPDEPRFADDATVAKMRMEPRTVRGGPRGDYRVFLLVSRAEEIDDARWSSACADAAATLAGAAGVTAVVENIVTFPPAPARLVDAVIEGWLDTQAAAAALVRSADAAFAGFADAIDRGRSFALAARTFPREHIRAHHADAQT